MFYIPVNGQRKNWFFLKRLNSDDDDDDYDYDYECNTIFF